VTHSITLTPQQDLNVPPIISRVLKVESMQAHSNKRSIVLQIVSFLRALVFNNLETCSSSRDGKESRDVLVGLAPDCGTLECLTELIASANPFRIWRSRDSSATRRLSGRCSIASFSCASRASAVDPYAVCYRSSGTNDTSIYSEVFSRHVFRATASPGLLNISTTSSSRVRGRLSARFTGNAF
jgi:hypothetical protein